MSLYCTRSTCYTLCTASNCCSIEAGIGKGRDKEMKKLHLLTLAAAALSFCLTPSLSASGIAVDAGWYGFCFSDAGSAISAGCQNDATAGPVGDLVTFTATGPVMFDITDAFQKGDSFDVNINSGAITFTTSSVPVDPSGATTDPNLAFADPTYSSGSVLLGPGSYTVDVTVDSSPYGGGGAYLQVASVSSVPEPSSMFLVGGGLLATFLAKRRMRKSQV